MNSELTEARFLNAADVMPKWRDDLLSGKSPVLYPVGEGELSRLEIGPGIVALLGGAPGAGKTAFVMQLVVDALRLTPELKAVICNVEMPPGILLDRQLARLSGIDLTTIRHRRLTAEHADRIDVGIQTLDGFAERLSFCRPPFDLANVAATADAFGAGLIVLDYVQRIAPPGDHGDKRGSVDALMSHIRSFADLGIAVIVVSAVGRSKDNRGRASYAAETLSLASYRESSELEFGADDAYILAGNGSDDGVTLRHLKSRNGSCRDLELTFDRPLQRFTARGFDDLFPASGGAAEMHSELARAWDQSSADEDSGEDWGPR